MPRAATLLLGREQVCTSIPKAAQGWERCSVLDTEKGIVSPPRHGILGHCQHQHAAFLLKGELCQKTTEILLFLMLFKRILFPN